MRTEAKQMREMFIISSLSADLFLQFKVIILCTWYPASNNVGRKVAKRVDEDPSKQVIHVTKQKHFYKISFATGQKRTL